MKFKKKFKGNALLSTAMMKGEFELLSSIVNGTIPEEKGLAKKP